MLARLFHGLVWPRSPAGESGQRSINQSMSAVPASTLRWPVAGQACKQWQLA
jgi:hypothetical protein